MIVGSRLETRGVVDPEVVQQTRGAQLSSDFASRDPMRRYADTKRCNAMLATALAAPTCATADDADNETQQCRRRDRCMIVCHLWLMCCF